MVLTLEKTCSTILEKTCSVITFGEIVFGANVGENMFGDFGETWSVIWRKMFVDFGENVFGDLEKLVQQKCWRFGESWSV